MKGNELYVKTVTKTDKWAQRDTWKKIYVTGLL
jgi:hypothetical protein